MTDDPTKEATGQAAVEALAQNLSTVARKWEHDTGMKVYDIHVKHRHSAHSTKLVLEVTAQVVGKTLT